MSKRYSRPAKAVLWLAALAVGGFSVAMLNRANQPTEQVAQRPIDGDPAATGSLQKMRWCGAASWCR